MKWMMFSIVNQMWCIAQNILFDYSFELNAVEFSVMLIWNSKVFIKEEFQVNILQLRENAQRKSDMKWKSSWNYTGNYSSYFIYKLCGLHEQSIMHEDSKLYLW